MSLKKRTFSWEFTLSKIEQMIEDRFNSLRCKMTGAYALIITGKAEQARRYQQALADAGFSVQVATTAARAQIQLAFTNPNLIVLDLHLPDISGDVVLRQINAKRRVKRVPVILISDGTPPSQADETPAPYVLELPASAADLAVLASKVCAI